MKNTIMVNGYSMSIADFEKADGLVIEGHLYLCNTAITRLPDNLSVDGCLDLENLAITELPDNLKVGGGLYFKGTLITCLPDNLSLGGSLYLKHTNITHLPNNLNVGGDLDLTNTPITHLPDDLKVGGHIRHSKRLILRAGEYTYVTGLFWPIRISDEYIRIGCEKHTIDEWDNFTDEEIDDMDQEALQFWRKHKEFILSEAQKSQ
jgi:hypothetical protein